MAQWIPKFPIRFYHVVVMFYSRLFTYRCYLSSNHFYSLRNLEILSHSTTNCCTYVFELETSIRQIDQISLYHCLVILISDEISDPSCSPTYLYKDICKSIAIRFIAVAKLGFIHYYLLYWLVLIQST